MTQVDYEAESVLSSKIREKSGGFINGNFSSGKLKEIYLNSKAFVIKFNIDSTILAVGTSDGGGVELYETSQFHLIHTIERTSTVSALDWVEYDEEIDAKELGKDEDNKNSQLLAVGSFDGFVKIYCINSATDDVTLVDSFQVESAVCSMSFVKDSATNYAPRPLSIATGDRNGNVAIVNLGEYVDMSKNAERIRILDAFESPVLSMTFGFFESNENELSPFHDGISIIMVCGLRNGQVKASIIRQISEKWHIVQVLLDLERQGAIRTLRFNHDGTTLIVGGYDKTVLFINTILWEIVRELEVDGTVRACEVIFFFCLMNEEYSNFGRSALLRFKRLNTTHTIDTYYSEVGRML